MSKQKINRYLQFYVRSLWRTEKKVLKHLILKDLGTFLSVLYTDAMTDKKCQKVPHIYRCIKCDYTTCHLSHWKKHIQTKKHTRLTNTDVLTDKKCQKVPFICDCGKTYKHRQSLFTHKQKCKYVKDDEDNKQDDEDILRNMIKAIQVQQNQINDLIELMKNK